VKETVWGWDLLNDNKALWLRSPADVSEAEYTKFYQALAKARALTLPPPRRRASGTCAPRSRTHPGATAAAARHAARAVACARVAVQLLAPHAGAPRPGPVESAGRARSARGSAEPPYPTLPWHAA